MGLRKMLFVLLVAAGAFVFLAGSAQATISYVHPSTNGGTCSLGDTNPCVSVLPGGILEVGDGTNIVQYQIVGVGGVVSGTTVDFTFNGTAPGTSATSTFQVLACGYEAGFGNPASPGIYDSGGIFLSASCTPLGDVNCPSSTNAACATNPSFTVPSNFVTDNKCTITDTVCLSFSGIGLPSTWFFAEDVATISSTNCNTDPNTGAVLSCQTTADGPTVSFITETTGVPSTVPTPEPASLTLLAAGVAGLGALWRKRTG